MKPRFILTYCLFFVFFISCKNERNTDYFSTDTQIISQSQSIKLTGTPLINDLIGTSNIEIVDNLIVLISPRNEKIFKVFDLEGNFKGDFGLRGQGPNDLLNCRPTGQKDIANEEAFIWVNDISNSSLKKVNLSKSILEQQLLVESALPTYPMSMNAFKLNDSITIAESMTHDNYALIKYDYKSGTKLLDKNVYRTPVENPFSFYKSTWRVNHKKDKVMSAMFSINQLNLWNLDTDEKKSIAIEKTYQPDQIINKETGLENRTFFCDLEVSKDFVFALYMDQDYNVSYELPKKMTVFVFDWDLNPVATYEVDEYILDIAVDPKQKKLYGVSEDDMVFEYSLTELFTENG